MEFIFISSIINLLGWWKSWIFTRLLWLKDIIISKYRISNNEWDWKIIIIRKKFWLNTNWFLKIDYTKRRSYFFKAK